MIILDTNVLSELVRLQPAPEVRRWLLYQTQGQALATTAITVSEIEYGISRMPRGRRRKELEQRFAALTGAQFEFAVLPLDEKAARLAGRMRGARETLGLHAQSADMMIAAICALAGASLATRNVKDFKETGIEVIDPWSTG